MIFLYIAVILVVFAGAIGLFVWYQKKDEKRYKTLTKVQKEESSPAQEESNATAAQPAKAPEPVVQDANFEDFTLADVDESQKSLKAHSHTPDFDEEDERDQKLSAYERFLRQQLDDDDDDFNEDTNFDNDDSKIKSPSLFDDDDFNNSVDDSFKNSAHNSSLDNFDFNTLAGKSESEIKELIKDLPPKAQEIIMTDILARKDWNDED